MTILFQTPKDQRGCVPVTTVQQTTPKPNGRNAVFYYYKTACLALWGQSASILAALRRVDELRDTLEMGLKSFSLYDSGGIYRVGAAIHYKSKKLALLNLYDPEKALGYINHAIRLGPNNYQAYFYKAEILIELSKNDEAKRLLREKTKNLEAEIESGNFPDLTISESKIYLVRMQAYLSTL